MCIKAVEALGVPLSIALQIVSRIKSEETQVCAPDLIRLSPKPVLVNFDVACQFVNDIGNVYFQGSGMRVPRFVGVEYSSWAV